jgi:L-ascorbate metabolism protein UlaG (beta-lactamase superfamily)
MQLIALLGISLSLVSADSLEVRFVGNAGFELSDGVTTLLVDLPYESGAFDFMEYDPATLDPAGRVVAVITHRHADHFEPELFRATSWDIIGPQEVTDGFEPGRVLTARIVNVGDFRIQRFPTPHRDTEHYSYLIDWRGHRMYFVGDTDSPNHLLSTEGLDTVFLTPWLSCALDAAGERPPADRVVLHHQSPDERLQVCGQPVVMAQDEVLTLGPR